MRLTSQLAVAATSSRTMQATRVCSSGWPRSQSSPKASSSCMGVSRFEWKSGAVGADEDRRIDAHVVEADVPVQVRAGGAAGGAHLAEHLAARQALADADIHLGQVAEHADQSLAVVDEHRAAVEEVVADQDHLAGGRRAHRCTGRSGEVQAGMRVALLAIEEAAQAERRGQAAFHRSVEMQVARLERTEAPIGFLLLGQLATDARQGLRAGADLLPVLQGDVLLAIGALLHLEVSWLAVDQQGLAAGRGLQRHADDG